MHAVCCLLFHACIPSTLCSLAILATSNPSAACRRQCPTESTHTTYPTRAARVDMTRETRASASDGSKRKRSSSPIPQEKRQKPDGSVLEKNVRAALAVVISQ